MNRFHALAVVALLAAGLSAPPVYALDTSRAELEQLQKAVDLNPTSPDAHFDLAMGLARTVKLESGYVELRRISELDPGYPDKVIARYKPMVEENDQNVEAFFRLAFGYYFKGWVLSQASRDQAKVDPVKAEALGTEAAGYKAQSRAAFEAIVTRDPRYIWGYNYLGYLLYDDGQSEAGMEQWRKSIGVEDNAVAHFLLGQALIRAGKLVDGVNETSRAMAMRGLNP